MTKQKSRIFWREGKEGATGRTRTPRAYGDFREYADVGGKREPLIATGEKRATTDATVAQVLIARRLEELENLRRGRAISGRKRNATLAAFAAEHLVAKKREGHVTDFTLATQEIFLRRAIDYLGADRELASIGVSDVRAWADVLRKLPNGRGTTMTPGSVRHNLNALSNLYRRAQEEELVPPGYNPVAAWMSKPKHARSQARWLEVHEAALLLESARTAPSLLSKGAVPTSFGHALIATFLLTGGRTSEVLGLEAQDVSFDRMTVTFRPNRWRRLKTEGSHRVVPLWPQLHDILQAHLFDRPPGDLLFPSYDTGREAMVTDFRKLLDRVGERAGWPKGHVRSRMFRHTYASARLQTLDHGAPVSVYTVSRELGHGSEEMLRRVYGHLGVIRHRAEVVEYRIENYDSAASRFQHGDERVPRSTQNRI